MGFFTPSRQEQEQARGVSDSKLKTLDNDKLIMLALAEIMEQTGIKDDALFQELQNRGAR